MSTYKIYNHAERPELAEQLSLESWPTFMLHSGVAAAHYPYMYEHYTEFQFYLCDEADTDTTVGDGVSIPVAWDGTVDHLPDGWDAALSAGVNRHKEGVRPTTLCALAATVSPGHLGKGISKHIIKAMKSIAKKHGLNGLIAPVRPSLKSRYPLTPIENYIQWKRDDGLFFDPWLRVHQRQNAKFLKIAPESMRITGTVAEWEEWTQMKFPESGQYVIEGALAPLTIDREKDEGLYIEANVWMLHNL